MIHVVIVAWLSTGAWHVGATEFGDAAACWEAAGTVRERILKYSAPKRFRVFCGLTPSRDGTS